MKKTVKVDYLPESVARHPRGGAIVAIDVIRATTTAITAAALGRRCYAAPHLEAARALAAKLERPILAGELAGCAIDGFEMDNSPAEIALRTDIHRPLVLLSSSGTKLMHAAQQRATVYPACYRNWSAVAAYVAARHGRVTVIGAGSRGEFREEDQICSAWIAGELARWGYAPADQQTLQIMERWRGAPAHACLGGKSAEYLLRSGKARDLDFVLSRVNDLDAVSVMRDGEVAVVPAGRERFQARAEAIA